MKRLAYIFTLILVLVGCGSRNGYFSLEGRLLNLNQGEFYVYSPDGVFDGVDTIKVEGGRFTFETPCRQDGTLMIVFPNFSEQPVFAEAGKSVTISGDASHLKEIKIEGTDENKLMTAFRQQIAKASPPEVFKHAEQFIRDNATSAVSVYLVRKYFVSPEPTDYDKAEKLLDILYKAQPKNGNLARMSRHIKMMKSHGVGSKMPSFATVDINGNAVTDAVLRGKVAVVYTWADWSYESRSMRDRLNRLKNEYGDRLALLGISLDADRNLCKRTLLNDSTSSVMVCDQKMFESPLMSLFAFGGISENVLFNAQGVIVERNLALNDIESKLKVLLN